MVGQKPLLFLALVAPFPRTAGLIALSGLPSADLMWSSRPLNEATIRVDGAWEDVPGTNVTVNLEVASDVLVSYGLTATAVRRASAANALGGGSDFYSSSVALLGAGQRNFLQARVTIDGAPFRQSSSHMSPGLSLEANTDTLTGHAAVLLDAGTHDVRLQWKKTGQGVSSWASRPSAADGFTSGRSLVVTGRHEYMWHTHADSVARIDTDGAWENMTDSSLTFTLPTAASLRFLYSMSVRSDQVDVESGGNPPLFIFLNLHLHGIIS